jgi:hypothetical protein
MPLYSSLSINALRATNLLHCPLLIQPLFKNEMPPALSTTGIQWGLLSHFNSDALFLRFSSVGKL